MSVSIGEGLKEDENNELDQKIHPYYAKTSPKA
jgi:hypothetical protein